MFLPSPHDPYRSVNWRWERARWLREKGKYARRGRDDVLTVRAKKFQLALSKVKNDLDEEKLATKDPIMWYTYQVYSRQDRDTRWALEARVLARQTSEEIANKVLCTPEVVTLYEDLFFDVRDKLDHLDYVCNVVMGRSIHMGLAERDHDLLWKLFAYMRGPLVLDALICKFTNPSIITSLDQVGPSFGVDHREFSRRKAALSSLTLPVAYNQQIIMEHYGKLLDIEQNSQGGTDTEDLLKRNVHAMVMALKFSVAGRSVDLPQMADYDKQSAEPRAGELVAIALGREDPSLRKQLANMPFPETTDVGQEDQQGR